jgi:hypothetical protein
MRDNTNKKVLGKFKDEMNTLLIKEFLALNPKVYSIMHQPMEQDGEIVDHNTKKCKGVSKTVVKKEIQSPGLSESPGDEQKGAPKHHEHQEHRSSGVYLETAEGRPDLLL